MKKTTPGELAADRLRVLALFLGKAENLSVGELARSFDMDASYLSRVVSGDRKSIGMGTVQKVVAASGIDPAFFTDAPLHGNVPDYMKGKSSPPPVVPMADSGTLWVGQERLLELADAYDVALLSEKSDTQPIEEELVNAVLASPLVEQAHLWLHAKSDIERDRLGARMVAMIRRSMRATSSS